MNGVSSVSPLTGYVGVDPGLEANSRTMVTPYPERLPYNRHTTPARVDVPRRFFS